MSNHRSKKKEPVDEKTGSKAKHHRLREMNNKEYDQEIKEYLKNENSPSIR